MSISDINDFFSTRVKSIETHLATTTGAEEAKEAKSKVRDVSTSRATNTTLQSHTSPEFEAQLLRQIQFRLKFLEDIGLGYLGLDRPRQHYQVVKYGEFGLQVNLELDLLELRIFLMNRVSGFIHVIRNS